MSQRTIVLSAEAIDLKVARNGARAIEPETIDCETHPAVLALPQIEQEIWVMHCAGMQGIDIAADLNVRTDVVCRTIALIKAKFEFLIRFREQLERRPSLKEKFYNLARTKDIRTKDVKCEKLSVKK